MVFKILFDYLFFVNCIIIRKKIQFIRKTTKTELNVVV